MNRFKAKVLPTINITKWYDSKLDLTFYDLYINGRYECRYSNKEDLLDRIKLIMNVEVVENVDK